VIRGRAATVMAATPWQIPPTPPMKKTDSIHTTFVGYTWAIFSLLNY
jgi:hypothetical protein